MCVQGSWFQAVNTFSSSPVWIQIIGLTHIYGFFSQRLTQSKHLTSQIFVLYKTTLLWGKKLNPLLSRQETETHKTWDLPKVLLKIWSRPVSRTEGSWILGHRWRWFIHDSHQWNFAESRLWLWAWVTESRIRGAAVKCGQPSANTSWPELVHLPSAGIFKPLMLGRSQLGLLQPLLLPQGHSPDLVWFHGSIVEAALSLSDESRDRKWLCLTLTGWKKGPTVLLLEVAIF